MNRMVLLKMGKDKYQLEVICSIDAAWFIYWQTLTSVQNIEDEWYLSCYDIEYRQYYNLTKGTGLSERDYGPEYQFIKFKKDIEYIRSVLSSLDKIEGVNITESMKVAIRSFAEFLSKSECKGFGDQAEEFIELKS